MFKNQIFELSANFRMKFLFLLRQAIAKFFLCYNLSTHELVLAKLGAIWTKLWPNQNDYIQK